MRGGSGKVLDSTMAFDWVTPVSTVVPVFMAMAIAWGRFNRVAQKVDDVKSHFDESIGNHESRISAVEASLSKNRRDVNGAMRDSQEKDREYCRSIHKECRERFASIEKDLREQTSALHTRINRVKDDIMAILNNLLGQKT